MKLPRRSFLNLAAGAAALPSMSRIARAQVYPSRPVRVIVPYSAGGPQDIITRLLCQWLAERFGQQFIVDNRPGGGGNIGAEVVVKSAPDGYSLLSVGPNNAINTTLYDKLNFDFIRDTVPVAGISRQSQLMLVNPSVPAKTVPEFIAYAKANPGKVNMASAGFGSGPHLSGELSKLMAHVNSVHVPDRGASPAVTDLISGQVQVMFVSPFGMIEYIQAGKIRALAVTTTTRSDALPDLPVLSDFLPGFESFGWFGVSAPKNTAIEVIERLNVEINAGLADPKIKARLSDLGGRPLAGSPADFGKLIAEETEKWGKVVRAANIKPE